MPETHPFEKLKKAIYLRNTTDSVQNAAAANSSELHPLLLEPLVQVQVRFIKHCVV